jgi:hypothetical protein
MRTLFARTLIALIAVLCAWPAGAVERLAVLDVTGDGTLSDDELAELTQQVRDATAGYLDPAEWTVIDAVAMGAMIQAKAAELAGCEGECEADIGRAIGAQRVVSGSAIVFDEAYSLALKLVDATTGEVLGSEDVTAQDMDEIQTGIAEACAALFADPAEEAALADLEDAPPPREMRTRRGRKKGPTDEEVREQIDGISDVPDQRDDGPRPPHRRLFRLGFNGFAALDQEGNGVTTGTGAALMLPYLHVMVGHGLGFRVAFAALIHRGDASSANISYYDQYQVPESLTGSTVPASFLAAGALVEFEYEITVGEASPAYPFFHRIQPFVGVGAALMSVQTTTDLPEELGFLITGEAGGTADPDATPHASQFRPGIDLFGGIHINLADAFRISFEVGYTRIDVPGEPTLAGSTAEPVGFLVDSAEGHYAYHEPYVLDDLRLGGGFAFMF